MFIEALFPSREDRGEIVSRSREHRIERLDVGGAGPRRSVAALALRCGRLAS